jgi:hypothetical protein
VVAVSGKASEAGAEKDEKVVEAVEEDAGDEEIAEVVASVNGEWLKRRRRRRLRGERKAGERVGTRRR